MAKWIDFFEQPPNPNRKTQVWLVANKDNGVRLGEIKWHGAWRGYAFFPDPGTLYEPTCLRDVADFIQQQNQARRSAAKTLAEPQ